MTRNSSGYVNELYDNIICAGGNCDPTTGTPISVTQANNTPNINFALNFGGTISGRVFDEVTHASINSRIGIYDGSGNLVSYGYTDFSGIYTAGGLPTGNYFAVTQNYSGYLDKLYDNISCSGGNCTVTTGTPIGVTLGANTDGINFVLQRPCIFCDDFSSLDFNTAFGPWITKPSGSFIAATGAAVGTTVTKADLFAPNFGGCANCTVESQMSVQTVGGRISAYGWYADNYDYVELRLSQDKQVILLIQKANIGGIKFHAKAKVAFPLNLNQTYDVLVTFNSGTGQFTVTIDGVAHPLLTLNKIPGTIPSGNYKFRVKTKLGIPTNGTLADVEIYP